MQETFINNYRVIKHKDFDIYFNTESVAFYRKSEWTKEMEDRFPFSRAFKWRKEQYKDAEETWKAIKHLKDFVLLEVEEVSHVTYNINEVQLKGSGNQENSDLIIEFNGLSGMTKKLKTRWDPENELEVELIKSAISPSLCEYSSGYPDDQPTMGFFMFGAVDPELVKKQYPGTMTPEDKKVILEYMENSTEEKAYMGSASSRMDGSLLGSRDMKTPDNKWIFPEKWDVHYVDKYDICPPKEFVEDAIKWMENNE